MMMSSPGEIIKSPQSVNIIDCEVVVGDEVLLSSEKSLVQITKTSLGTLFSEGGLDIVQENLLQKAKEYIPNLTTPAGRTECERFARKFVNSRTGVDRVGKEYNSDLKKRTKEVDGVRSGFNAAMKECEEIILRPLNELKRIEKERTDVLLVKVQEIVSHGALLDEMGTAKPLTTLEVSKAYLEGLTIDSSWAEFQIDAETKLADAIMFLTVGIAQLKESEELKRQVEEAETKLLAQEKLAHEKLIAEQATAKAKAEAEKEARELQERTKREKEEAVRKANADKEKANMQVREAEARAIRAEEDAARKVELAEQQAKAKLEAEVLAKQKEEAKRTADVEHRKKINNEILNDLLPVMDALNAKKLIGLMVQNKIKHVQVRY